jgi:hypothetical protein
MPKDIIDLTDDENDSWLHQVRADRLRKQGWHGSVQEYFEATRILKTDPLKHKPPVKSLAEAKKLVK